MLRRLPRILLSLIVLVIAGQYVFCQVSELSNEADERFKGIIYRKEFAIDLGLHTKGWFIAYNSGDIKTYYRTNYYTIQFSTLHDDQEFKQAKNFGIINGTIPDDFKFGKQNSAFLLRGGKGTKKYLTDKAKRRGVSIGYDMEFGPTLAMLKPYYLQFVEQKIVNGELRNQLVDKKYSEETEKQFLDYNQIYGGSPFKKGLSEMGFVPGIHAKLGAFFSIGVFDQYVKAAEVGIIADGFIKKLPIMIETETNRNSPLFLNLYVNLHFGKRSN